MRFRALNYCWKLSAIHSFEYSVLLKILKSKRACLYSIFVQVSSKWIWLKEISCFQNCSLQVDLAFDVLKWQVIFHNYSIANAHFNNFYLDEHILKKCRNFFLYKFRALLCDKLPPCTNLRGNIKWLIQYGWPATL